MSERDHGHQPGQSSIRRSPQVHPQRHRKDGRSRFHLAINDSKVTQSHQHRASEPCGARLTLTGFPLARIGFAFGRDADGSATLLIGGVQGLEPGTDKKIIVRATRALSGLRPKDAALVAVQAVARTTGIRRLLAVTNANHVLAAEWFMSDSVISRDYEAFWTERGGQPDGDRGYELPMPNYQARVAATATPRLVDQYRAAISAQVKSRLTGE